eukprot:1594943-Amphidinium_carterae.1
MVIEAHSSAMSPFLLAFVDFVARQHSSAARKLSHSSISLDIAQRIAVAAIRESARAILKRS